MFKSFFKSNMWRNNSNFRLMQRISTKLWYTSLNYNLAHNFGALKQLSISLNRKVKWHLISLRNTTSRAAKGLASQVSKQLKTYKIRK